MLVSRLIRLDCGYERKTTDVYLIEGVRVEGDVRSRGCDVSDVMDGAKFEC